MPIIKFQQIIVKVPASSANLGPGFDTLALALNRYLTLRVEPHHSLIFTTENRDLEPYLGKGNLIEQSMSYVFQQAKEPFPLLKIEVTSEIPLARGLGSSAAAIIGGMLVANLILNNYFTLHELFTWATEMEGHPDNVGAALFGGIVVTNWDKEKRKAVKISIPPVDLAIIAVIPSYPLTTKKAREVLPAFVPFSDAVFNLANSALLVAALYSKQYDFLKIALNDRLHQPYRFPLMPDMQEIIDIGLKNGAISGLISGAGPTCLLITEVNKEKEVLSSLTPYQNQYTITKLEIATGATWRVLA